MDQVARAIPFSKLAIAPLTSESGIAKATHFGIHAPTMSEPSQSQLLTTNRKALSINLDPARYGTFAEIGAGQETARVFFQAGGAAGTIAKTISAYDMTFSDEIYGKAERYVSRSRLYTMLEREYELLEQRLGKTESEKCFFAFANTVKTKPYQGPNDAHGWLGVRYQNHHDGKPNEIVLHARMWDESNIEQQHAIGALGANLLYGAFYYVNQPEKLIESLIDNIGPNRIEIDLIKFSGPDFAEIENRIMNLHLVRKGLTQAVLFSPEGKVELAANALYKRAVLVERGSFRPVTKLNIDMLKCAGAQFIQEPALAGKDVIVMAEITMNNLLAGGEIDYDDFIHRIDSLATTGNYTLISNYFEFYRLTQYFRRYTNEMIGIAMGINNLLEVFNDKYYTHLPGGILESFGRLFRNAVKLYVYPMKQKAYRHYLEIQALKNAAPPSSSLQSEGIAGELLITCENLRIESALSNLYRHLLENGYIEHIRGIDESLMDIFSRDILDGIARGDTKWETMVPEKTAGFIKEQQLFGYRPE